MKSNKEIKRLIRSKQQARRTYLKLLKQAEDSHAKAGKNIKLLRKSLKKRGYL